MTAGLMARTCSCVRALAAAALLAAATALPPGRLFDVALPAHLPLGLQLDAQLRVAGWHTAMRNATSVAAASGLIQVGDNLVGVDGESLAGRSLADVAQLLRPAADAGAALRVLSLVRPPAPQAAATARGQLPSAALVRRVPPRRVVAAEPRTVAGFVAAESDFQVILEPDAGAGPLGALLSVGADGQLMLLSTDPLASEAWAARAGLEGSVRDSVELGLDAAHATALLLRKGPLNGRAWPGDTLIGMTVEEPDGARRSVALAELEPEQRVPALLRALGWPAARQASAVVQAESSGVLPLTALQPAAGSGNGAGTNGSPAIATIRFLRQGPAQLCIGAPAVATGGRIEARPGCFALSTEEDGVDTALLPLVNRLRELQPAATHDPLPAAAARLVGLAFRKATHVPSELAPASRHAAVFAAVTRLRALAARDQVLVAADGATSAEPGMGAAASVGVLPVPGHRVAAGVAVTCTNSSGFATPGVDAAGAGRRCSFRAADVAWLSVVPTHEHAALAAPQAAMVASGSPAAHGSAAIRAVPALFGGSFPCPERGPLRLAAAEPLDACGAVGRGVRGAVALVRRGVCTFPDKAVHAQAAGAAGLIVINDAHEPPFAMPGAAGLAPGSGSRQGHGPQAASHGGHDAAIPVAMVSHADGEALLAAARAAAVDGGSKFAAALLSPYPDASGCHQPVHAPQAAAPPTPQPAPDSKAANSSASDTAAAVYDALNATAAVEGGWVSAAELLDELRALELAPQTLPPATGSAE